MLPRASKIHQIIGCELLRREKVLEIDRTITKIHFEMILDKTGEPVRVLYQSHGLTDLTNRGDLSK